MIIKTSVFAAVVAASFAFSPMASAAVVINGTSINKDIEDMSDEELVEARDGIQEGLEEIRESREEISDRMVEEDTGRIESAALGVAEGALDAAEDTLEEVLEDIEDEQKSRK